jgi:8-oxo-dGTP pyrophosphatase MutT (NUDIX family)
MVINIIMDNISKMACGAIFLCSSTGRVLLNLRSPYKTHQLHWSLWGGMVEGSETPIECLLREIGEEVGFTPDITKINPFDVFESNDGHFRYYSYICVVDDEFIPNINKEAVGYCWTKLGVWPTPMHRGAKVTLCNPKSLRRLNLIIDHSNSMKSKQCLPKS